MNRKSFFIKTKEEMLFFGQKLAKMLSPGDVLYLQGDLGAGKTTLMSGVLKGLGCQEHAKSPTYTIVESYELPHCRVFHFDLYRITDPEGLVEMGFVDYLDADAILALEWPEKGLPHLPEATLMCRIDYADSGRELEISAKSARGQKIIDRVEGLLPR